MNTCKCGCGRECKQTYLKGHARKGKAMSQTHKESISASNKGKKRSIEQRVKMSEDQKGKKHSEASKEKLSLVAKEKGFGKWMVGKSPSPETRAKIASKNIGRIVSEETRVKISEKNKGVNNGMFGRGHTEEAKAKISEASREMWLRDDIRDKCKTVEFSERMRRARELLVMPKSSSMEDKLAKLLATLSIPHIRHKYIKIPHKYQADFFLPKHNIVIECDGIYWHEYPNLRVIDILRGKEMEDVGLRVVRFWEHEVLPLNSDILSGIIRGKSKLDYLLPTPYNYIKKLERCVSLFSKKEIP
jgi:very-short-patch-repair endonuclease